MEASRTKKIVAVFGSTEEGQIPLARRIGTEISTRGCYILLTGGTGEQELPKKEQGTVKEQAILGAKPSAWIGVTRGSRKPACATPPDAKWFVVKTDLEHKRNALEACLCDAAIVLEGNEGTISEAVFTLWLGKPVVFIGNSWKAYKMDAQIEKAEFTKMVEAALKRVGVLSSPDAPLDTLFEWNDISKDLAAKANYLWLPSPTTEEEASGTIRGALDWLQERINGAPQGYFPGIKRYATVIREYNKWTSGV
jgi:predicted Rossmann-fold nucleotide-binding protein